MCEYVCAYVCVNECTCVHVCVHTTVERLEIDVLKFSDIHGHDNGHCILKHNLSCRRDSSVAC